MPFGLALSDTAPLGFIPDQQAFFLIAHSTEEQLANIQKVLFAQFKALAKTKALFLVDLESELKEQHDLFNQVFTNDLEDIAALKQLMADYVQAATENRRLESAIMYIADLEQFFKGTNFNLADFKLTIQKGRQAAYQSLSRVQKTMLAVALIRMHRVFEKSSVLGWSWRSSVRPT
ncbi:hypothetical protein [Latilactobacillus fuchuensis]|uniref:hypothetical protein n=1 Tax=Latilactobacillus fuchuensis TaxID=164393 RepID=UPI0006846A3D|nr:hypothetical protein [Latilactobacillus fuchuensis]